MLSTNYRRIKFKPYKARGSRRLISKPGVYSDEYDFLVRTNYSHKFAKVIAGSIDVSWSSSCSLQELLKISWSTLRVQKLQESRVRSQI